MVFKLNDSILRKSADGNYGPSYGMSLERILRYSMGAMFFLYLLVTACTFLQLPGPLETALYPGGSGGHGGDGGVLPPPRIEGYGRRTSFPNRVDPSTYETIPHPAAGDAVSVLSVPPFWDPLEFGPRGGVREYLGFGRRLMTPAEARTIGSYAAVPSDDGSGGLADLETIFVAIASYRDFQCRQTVGSVFSRAKYPQRVRVAVIDQYAYGDKNEPVCSKPEHPCSDRPDQVLCKYASQIDFYPMEAKYAVGPVFARHLGNRMYRGEYFVVQSDAHVDYIRDWDESIVSQWKSANNEMAVLTAYLSGIEGHINVETGESIANTRPIMCMSDYEGSGAKKHLRHGQQPEGPAGIKGEPTLEPYWAAGFSFARGHFLLNVPYDQHLPMIFMGEEISIGLRGFTYGYDYYTAERSSCFHYYATQDKTGKRNAVKKFWENTHLYSGAETKAMMRLNGIIGMNPEIEPSNWDHVDEKLYGLGQVRTKEKFFDTFGIDPVKKVVAQNLCRFVGKNMHRIWKTHLRKDGMGIDYGEIDYKFQDPEKFGRTWEKDPNYN